MKKLFLILVLCCLVWGGSAFAIMDKDKLAELMSNSFTDYGAKVIEENCYFENTRVEFLFSSRCKCAIKAAKSKNTVGVKKIGESCDAFLPSLLGY